MACFAAPGTQTTCHIEPQDIAEVPNAGVGAVHRAADHQRAPAVAAAAVPGGARVLVVQRRPRRAPDCTLRQPRRSLVPQLRPRRLVAGEIPDRWTPVSCAGGLSVVSVVAVCWSGCSSGISDGVRFERRRYCSGSRTPARIRCGPGRSASTSWRVAMATTTCTALSATLAPGAHAIHTCHGV